MLGFLFSQDGVFSHILTHGPLVFFASWYLIAAITYVIVSYVRNPLRKIPAAHPLAPFTNLWISWIRWRAVENATLKDAHKRLGPIICLGPKEISVNCVKGGIREVYGGGFEKGDGKYNWYDFFTNYGGVDNLFSTASNKAHSTQKRMISNIYSKSVITSSPALKAQISKILYNRFLPYLERTLSQDQPGVLNVYALLSATTMDIVTAYIFGLNSSSNYIDDPPALVRFLSRYHLRNGFTFWPQEFPRLTEAISKWTGYRFAPKWVDEANAEIEQWTVSMCDSAAGVLQQSDIQLEDTPVVYQQLSTMLDKRKGDAPVEAEKKFLIASEVLDHLAAGFDTSGITLTYAIHELSQRPDIQAELRAELLGLAPRLESHSAPELPDPKSVDALPLLHAVVWETLRLHSAIPGPQPRFTPPQGCRLGPEGEGYYIPGDVRVSASAGALHANEEVYERASEWTPKRWLQDVPEEKKKDMESRWFWAFGSGGRMCVGSHLAVYQIKYILAALYTNYTTSIVDDTAIEQTDAYTAPPKNDRLLIRISPVKTG